MKIFTDSQIRALDKYTIEHEPIRPIDLMERAARALTKAIADMVKTNTEIVVFAGPGNNGGDALAVSRLLAEQGMSVSTYLFDISNKLSEECALNKERLKECKQLKHFSEITQQFDPPQLEAHTLVIDGLFGTGLTRPLSGGFASLVRYINQSPAQIVSIDIPSGLMTEDNTYNILANIIRADVTLTFQMKKLSFLMADIQQFIGKLQIIDIKLNQDFIKRTETAYNIIEKEDVKRLLKPRNDFAHKGMMGNALIIAGRYGMAGAAVLATKACLRAGAGRVTTLTPKKNCAILQASIPEAILHIDNEETYFSEAIAPEDFDAIGIGPGLGQTENTAIAMIAQIRRSQIPIVIDADAINILANHRAWIQQLPKEIIMTPHPKEFERLDGNHSNGDYERLSKARDMAKTLHAYILLKGHYSALCLPNGNIVFNSTGNSGMATAGSGDVLTGIITALLARGYKREDACLLGMYLHGLAGDLAAEELGKESLIAGDIIDYLPKAFRKLEE
ncbi:MAG: NAD(P)H-hydrate dehydratase [Prevotella sp.]|nr:NAD(P)H-hydrate dehydratase [Prevotella sp.]